MLILGIGQGLVLCTALFIKRPIDNTRYILGFLLFILLVNLLEFLLLSSSYYIYFPHLVYVSQPFLFLLGPLFYFYIITQTQIKLRFSYTHLLHTIPFLLALIYNGSWYLETTEYKLLVFERNLSNQNSEVSIKGAIYAFIHIGQVLVYLISSLNYLRMFNADSKPSRKKLSFLKGFSVTFTFYWILQLLGLISIIIFRIYTFEIDYVLALANSFFIQGLTLHIILNPHSVFTVTSKARYGNSSLDNTHYNTLLTEINQLLKRDEIYLESELTLEQFSRKLSINKNYISQIINQEFGINFNDFINNFRIEKAKELLENPENDEQKLLAVAFDTGFNNKTSFTRVFKKKTGMTPSEYRNTRHSSNRLDTLQE